MSQMAGGRAASRFGIWFRTLRAARTGCAGRAAWRARGRARCRAAGFLLRFRPPTSEAQTHTHARANELKKGHAMVAAAAVVQAPKRTFVPQDLDLADWSQIEPVGKRLLERPINSAAELERWLVDASELAAVVDEYGSRRYIDKSCHTDDKEIERRFL